MVKVILLFRHLLFTLVVATNNQNRQNENTVVLRSSIKTVPIPSPIITTNFIIKKSNKDIPDSDNFYFKYPVKPQKNHVFFHLIVNVFSVVLENISTLPPILNQIYLLKKNENPMIVLDLIKSIIDFSKIQTLCSIKSILLNAEKASLLSSKKNVKEECALVVHFLTKNDIKVKSSFRKNKNLKKVILKKIPELKNLEISVLLKSRQILDLKFKRNMENTGIYIKEFYPFIYLLQELDSLSTYFVCVFNNIPKSYTDDFFYPWVLFKQQSLDKIKIPSGFIIVCEFVFYLLETDFIFGPQFQCSKQENSDAIIGVTKLLGVLYYVQKSKNADADYNLTLKTLNSYVEKASFIADLPANKKIIFMNYRLLQEKINIIKNYYTEKENINDIICGYIYCNVSIFCNSERSKSL